MNRSIVTIKCSDYEEGTTSVFIHADNGFWSGGLTFYIHDKDLQRFCDNLLEYQGKSGSVILEYGEPNDKWAYYIKLEAKPNDGWSHTNLKIHFIDKSLNQGAVELNIACTPPQINELGSLIKKSHLQKTKEIWKVNE